MIDFTATRDLLFIDGTWMSSAGGSTIDIVSPGTGETIGRVPSAGPSDVNIAVDAARTALESTAWGGLDGGGRAAVMRRFADALEARADLRARTVSTTNGMPISIARGSEATAPVELLRYYADLAEAGETEEKRPRVRPLPTSATGGSILIQKEPVGVIAAIAPWNYPAVLSMFKIAPALAAGCTIVLKPSPETSLDGYVLADAAIEASLPPGVLNIVNGGADVGSRLVSHPGVDKVAFTGSTGAGQSIGEVCGRLLRPATLELGGKSAAIVLDDADVDAVIAGLLSTSLLNSGQTCYMSTRILLPDSRYEEFRDRIVEAVEAMRVGDPLDPSTQLGPLVSERQRERVRSLVALGLREGATLLTGGGVPDGAGDGFFVEPTVFEGLETDSTLAREEIFGPVLTLFRCDTTDHAIRIANDSKYGLGGVVWTTDIDRGIEVASRVQSGSVGINGYSLDWGSPFGGIKNSGLGKELGPEGLEAYYRSKTIFLPL